MSPPRKDLSDACCAVTTGERWGPQRILGVIYSIHQRLTVSSTTLFSFVHEDKNERLWQMTNINPGQLQLLFCPNKALWLLCPTGGGGRDRGGGQGRGEGRNEVSLALFSWLHAMVLNFGFHVGITWEASIKDGLLEAHLRDSDWTGLGWRLGTRIFQSSSKWFFCVARTEGHCAYANPWGSTYHF